LVIFTGSWLSGLLAVSAAPLTFDDAASLRAMALLNRQPCASRMDAPVVTPVVLALAQAQPSAPASPEPSPSAPPSPTPSPSPSPPVIATPIPGAPGYGGFLYATPFPQASPVTPPPVPSPAPLSTASPGPVLLLRGSAAPSIAPKPAATPQPSPTPVGVSTLRPGYVAVLADKMSALSITKPGSPGDATGNVHIFYEDEVLVGDRAHYDGVRTITVTGNPYIIDNTKDTILYADRITFDTVSDKAVLYNGRGESSQGVQQGLVYYGAKDLQSDQHGVTHGNDVTLTTCERPRAGYHVTGRTLDYYPGDRIVISKAVMWLGAVAVFYIPKLVIPLRSVSDERHRPQFFPNVGYNQQQGYYALTHLSFGQTPYYYGYYEVDYYTKQGLTLGYNAQITKRNGRRQTNIAAQRVQNRQIGQTSYNVAVADTEVYSPSLRAQANYTYTSAYGPYTNFPPTQNEQVSVLHDHGTESQSYQFTHYANGTQSSSDVYSFTDTRSFSTTLQNSFTGNISHSQTGTTYGVFSSNATGSVDDLLHWMAGGTDYQLTFQKTFAQVPFQLNKEPELQIRPYATFPHFIFPVSSSFTIGEYNEPATPETTQRADLNFNFGPALYTFFGNQFSASVNVHQYAYGTGDLKASIQQNASLTSQVGTHFNNVLTYDEANYNGPAALPFQQLDVLSTTNLKNANDTMRFYNGDVYNLSLSFSTSFNALAQPVGYQLSFRPTSKSYATFQGSFVPGPGNGFYDTSTQLAFPLGIGGWLAFQGDVDWKNRAQILNKSIYYSRIIGDCYEIQLAYNQNSRQFTASLNLLAFPSQAVTFGLLNKGSLVPSSFNGL
jgi:hypothetical protein